MNLSARDGFFITFLVQYMCLPSQIVVETVIFVRFNIYSMSLFEKACLIIYRFAEKGLEVFLVNDAGDENPVWSIPHQEIPGGNQHLINDETDLIELESVETEDGKKCRAIAIEGDYHDIPSMRSLVKNDVLYLKDKLKTMIPDLDKGTFVTVKDVVKNAMPHEYAFIKELKEILTDRNLTQNI